METTAGKIEDEYLYEHRIHWIWIWSRMRGHVMVPAGVLCGTSRMNNQERLERWKQKVLLREHFGGTS